MSEALSEKRYSNLVNTLLFLFPLGFLSIKASGDLILVILMFIGVYSMFKHRINPITHNALKGVSLLSLGYFAAILLSIFASDKPSELLHYVNRDLHFLFTPFVALAIYLAKVNIKTLILSIKLSLILMGGLILSQYFDGVSRPSWVMNADLFGNLTVLFLFMSWSNIQTEAVKDLSLSVLSTIFGMTSIVLSGTRGAWVSFVVLFFVWLFLLLYKKMLDKKVGFLLLIAVLALGVFASTNTVIKNRSSEAVSEVSNWYNGVNINTSNGSRMEMYKAGLLAAKEKPILGYGYRNGNKEAAKFADTELQSSIANHNHLHNAYINTLVFGGVIALIALLALLFIPLKQFWQQLKTGKHTELAFLGIFLCVGYASFGVVNAMFGDMFMNAFYVLFLSILLPKIKKA
ncbi:MAG: hypothetical protein Ctma_0637 [Catillopecten margaritatus gill symbiont]|uniref:O-antigen ligase-related domain-containing protein n=1 Tax=Catillopecten margaritatus gill symbiont TaxID=3083288 RepID=A0AAU6PG07_9GAMM